MTTAAKAAPALPTHFVRALATGKRVAWHTLGLTTAEFLDACAAEDLIGLVHQRLREWQPNGDWPPALYSDLVNQARAGVAIELVRRSELISVLEALAGADVHPILLKGTPLAYDVYRAPASRPRHDTDLLIRRETLDMVRQVMAELGYVAPPACGGELLFCQFALAKQSAFGAEHVFDFHWKISTQSLFADLLTYDELTGDAISISALGPWARAAGPVHALLLACLHPVMHHRNVERVLWVYDIHLLAGRLSAPGFQRFGDLAVAKRVGSICAHQLRIARARFGTSIPGDLMSRLVSDQSREPTASYLRPGRRWHHEFVSSVRGLPRWPERLRLVREVLFPSPSYMLGLYGVTSRVLGFALLPGLYAHRNLAGIWKILAGRK